MVARSSAVFATTGARSLAGVHQVTWDASKLPSGIYFCRVEAGSFTATQKMVLMK